MADNYLITGYWGEPHVTAENDRGINAAMFGTGRFVLPVGEQFKAEYIGNNTIRMYDGKLMDNGAAAGIPVGEYVDLLIANAGQGMKRNDLIVFQYSQDASTLIESGVFTVIQGAETSGTASDPALTQADLLSGEAAFDQFALWRVSVSGTTISAPVKLFSVYQNNVDHAADKNNPHTVTKSQVGLGNVPNVATNDQTPTFTAASTLATLTSGEKLSVAFGKIAKAITDLISHIANKSNPHGVTASQLTSGTLASDRLPTVPVAKGGTGATSAANACANLGLSPAMVSNTEYATAERWNNQPVYAMAFQGGALPANGHVQPLILNQKVNVIFLEVMAVQNGTNKFIFPLVDGDGKIVARALAQCPSSSKTQVTVSTYADLSSYSVYGVIKYTK